MDLYLKEHYYDQIANLLNDTNDRTHAALQVDLSQLQQHNFNWFIAILNDVYNELPKWDAALFAAQKLIASEDEGFLEEGYQIKIHCRVRFVRLPPPDPRFKLPFPNPDQIGMFREIKGTVVRMSQMKLLEMKREFICTKCHKVIEIEADYALMYRFELPKNCSMTECKGNMYQKNEDPRPQYCVNYQELKIQDSLSEKNIPPTLNVTLDSDLVDSCQPGDCITICGTIERRWAQFNETSCVAVIAMRAVSMTREQSNLTVDENGVSEQMMTIKADWIEHLNKHGELGMRDIILNSICPDVYGMHPVKLAIALAICSGNDLGDTKSSDGLHLRGQSHILMVGDPGLAKSKLLLSAAAIAPRAVHTTGMGCSTAGLTAAAIKEDGEWQLEAGALVLADGGICCIDEFNLMRESDRASIHEAMEQQTISMAKAGIICKLNTRCAILAAANPRNLYAMSESEGTNAINIGIATPLLSRFDLVFILKDERIPQWDDAIAAYLLSQVTTGFEEIMTHRNSESWCPKKLRLHFTAITRVQPKLTSIASAILGAYYQKCRSDPGRHQGRTTIRLLDSLNRLAQAHARLVFREEVNVIDAIVTIRLMESTFGFGRVIKPYDVIKEELPLGPDEEEIKCILNILEIDEQEFSNTNGSIVEKTLSQANGTPLRKTKNAVRSNNCSQNVPTQVFSVQNVDANISGECSKSQNVIGRDVETSEVATQSAISGTSQITKQNSVSKTQISTTEAVLNMDLDELDAILSLDQYDKKDEKMFQQEKTQTQNNQSSLTKEQKTENPTGMSDDEDQALSQALDAIEQIQKPISEPKPTIPMPEPKKPRLMLNLKINKLGLLKNHNKMNVISSVSSTSSVANKIDDGTIVEATTQTAHVNRIFCTPSDDERSQTESSKPKLSVKTLNFLHSFKANQSANKSQVLSEHNVPATASKGDSSQKENDSAYESMAFIPSLPSIASGLTASCRKTGKTPELFLSSGATLNKIDDDDLSYLDSIEFD